MNLTLLHGAACDQRADEESSTQRYPLGQQAFDRLGRRYRYVRAGATATVAGSLYQAPAPIPNHLANTPPAVAVGATSFSYTPGATAGAANLYAGGLLQVDTTPGNGYTYAIKGHLAITSSTAFTLNLHEDSSIAVALTTSSRVGLRHNPYMNVIVAPTTLTAQPVGLAVCVITAAYYGWLLVQGVGSALINGTPAVTAPLINSATTAGALDVWTAAAQPTSGLIGQAAQVGVSGKNNFAFINLP